MTGKEITVRNVHGVDRDEVIRWPEGGGVVVAMGPNATGKSTLVESVQAITDPAIRKSLTPSVGHEFGEIITEGVRVRIGKANTIKGTPEFASIESAADPSRFVDPKIKDPELADAERIRIITRLSGVQVDSDAWQASLPEGVSIEDVDLTGDPVDVSDRIRRAINAQALLDERLSDEAKAIAKGLLEIQADPCQMTPDEAQAAVEDCIRIVSETRAAHDRRAVWLAQFGQAKKSLADADVPDLAALSEARIKVDSDVSGRQRELDDLVRQRDELLEKIKEAESKLAATKVALENIDKSRKVAIDLKTAVQGYQDTIDAPEVPQPDLSVEEAQKALDESRERVKLANAWKARCEAVERAKVNVAKAKTHDARAKLHRDAAAKVDGVLEKALTGVCPDLVVDRGRIQAMTPAGKLPISRLSVGQRYKLIFGVILRSLPPGSVLGIEQGGWGELDPKNKALVNQLAKEAGVYVITAEASDGEFRLESI